MLPWTTEYICSNQLILARSYEVLIGSNLVLALSGFLLEHVVCNIKKNNPKISLSRAMFTRFCTLSVVSPEATAPSYFYFFIGLLLQASLWRFFAIAL